MFNRSVKKLLTVLLLTGMLVAGTMPALAISPERLTIPVSGTYILAVCDGFEVIDEYTGLLTITEFYNQDGVLERLTFQENSQDRIYNSVTGFSVPSKYTVNQTYYPEISELYIRGVAYNITVPGYGPVEFDAGLGVYSIENGNYTETKFAGNYLSDTEALCEAMDQ
jgi:hypothetical protein